MLLDKTRNRNPLFSFRREKRKPFSTVLLSRQLLPNSALLSAALVWLVSVTLCSTRTIVPEDTDHEISHEHGQQSHHASEPDHEHGGNSKDGDCSCASFKDLPGLSVTLIKAPAPVPASLLYILPLIDFTLSDFIGSVTPRATGPPGRLSFSDQILVQCRFSHAPPFVATPPAIRA